MLNKGKFLTITCMKRQTYTKKFMILVFFETEYNRHQASKRSKICIVYMFNFYNKNVFNFHNKKEIIKVFHCTWSEIIHLGVVVESFTFIMFILEHFPVVFFFNNHPLIVLTHTIKRKKKVLVENKQHHHLSVCTRPMHIKV